MELLIAGYCEHECNVGFVMIDANPLASNPQVSYQDECLS